MKIKDIEKNERPMERLSFYGKENLSNSDLLAILIGSGTKGQSSIKIAEEILSSLDRGISALGDLTIEEITSFKGIGFSKASNIISAIELGKRVQVAKSTKSNRIIGVSSVIEMYKNKLRLSKQERFEVIMLDAKGYVIGVQNISKGDLTSSIVHPRETFREAIKRSAASIICVHNHPSGDPKPSEDDILITKRLVEAGDIVGIRLLDHIIIGSDNYTSLREENII